jgi:hypothetical protein
MNDAPLELINRKVSLAHRKTSMIFLQEPKGVAGAGIRRPGVIRIYPLPNFINFLISL